MSTVLLIIDVQKASCTNPTVAKEIEKRQYDYEHVFISRFVNKESPVILAGLYGSASDYYHQIGLELLKRNIDTINLR